MVRRGPYDPDNPGARRASERRIDPGPDIFCMILARLAVVAVFVAVAHFALEAWHGATIAALVLGAAWLLGRVD